MLTDEMLLFLNLIVFYINIKAAEVKHVGFLCTLSNALDVLSRNLPLLSNGRLQPKQAWISRTIGSN